MILAFFCGCIGRFASDLVGNPEDRFSCVPAQIRNIKHRFFPSRSYSSRTLDFGHLGIVPSMWQMPSAVQLHSQLFSHMKGSYRSQSVLFWENRHCLYSTTVKTPEGVWSRPITKLCLGHWVAVLEQAARANKLTF